ncbi:hypothetical protein EDC55_11414 [Allofrancisella inopinata]|uniref:Uncharacterized protein n=1 Tax=Allofrancisella inopinata TaxID=1085647 RepID=A0AAE6YIM2_9GAMM|nr:hypothetical protein [Allofrancisella inopinata]QIV95389.1 hypothetical protein E4K63_00465 [Allofrancisella inopinata]TDT70394.1 hypothetical protein EDC55_11414 [Allofrancisella inopinata]
MSVQKCQSCGFMWHSLSQFGNSRKDQCFRCGSTHLSTREMPFQYNNIMQKQQSEKRNMDNIFNKIIRYGDKHYIKMHKTYKTHLIVEPGSEKTSGCAVLIPDIDSSGITTISTYDLTGCQCIAIYGKSLYGTFDIFFAHSRLYDKYDDEIINKAREFIKAHHQNQIYWGTDFSAMIKDVDKLHDFICKTQEILSINLGCWVRYSHRIAAGEITFFPTLGFATPGNREKTMEKLSKGWLNSDIIESQLHTIESFKPASEISEETQQYLNKLEEKNKRFIRRWWHDDRRKDKIEKINKLLSSYRCGNLGVLVDMQKNTEDISVQGWKGIKAKQLAIKAAKDAVTRTRAFDPNYNCGIKEDGTEILCNSFDPPKLDAKLQKKVDMILQSNKK